eukprot:13334331-Ditylum_brightwellii.AAC.1
METLDVLTKWAAMADPKNSIKVVNIFEENGNTKEVVGAHVDLVWADMAHGSAIMPKYFKAFDTKQTNDATLITPRN